MDFNLTQILLLVVILFVTSFVQGSIGFAAGLLGIPAMMQIGLELSEAIAVSLISSGLQNVAGLVELRKHVDWSLSKRPLLIRIAALPLGVAALMWLENTVDKPRIQQVVGVLIFIALITQLVARVKPREHLHVVWEWIAFSLGGFLVGFCGMGGPPMMLWVIAHDWSTKKARAFMFSMFISSVVPQAILMWWLFGPTVLWAMLLTLLSAPICYAGSYLGVKAGDVAPKPVMRKIVYVVLFFVAFKGLSSPYFNQSQPPTQSPTEAEGSQTTAHRSK